MRKLLIAGLMVASSAVMAHDACRDYGYQLDEIKAQMQRQHQQSMAQRRAAELRFEEQMIYQTHKDRLRDFERRTYGK